MGKAEDDDARFLDNGFSHDIGSGDGNRRLGSNGTDLAYNKDKLRETTIIGDPDEPFDKKGKKKKKKDAKEKEKEKAKPTLPPVPYTHLFRFAKTADKILIFVGVLASVLAGLTTPIMVILFGDITETLVADASPENSTAKMSLMAEDGVSNEDFLDRLGTMTMYMAVLGAATFILMYVFVTSFNMIAENQVHRLRRNYLEALLRQNVGWYDTSEDRSFVSRMSEDVLKVQDAIGEKVGLCIYFMAVCLFSLANAFWHGWKLTLVVLSSAPVLAIVSGIVASIQSKLTTDEQASYAKAGKVAEEAITNIRTVMAFSGQQKEIDRYAEGLKIAENAGKKRGTISGIGVGLMWLIIYASYALAFWYGTKLILEDDNYTSSNLLIVFFSVLMGAFNIGQSASYFEAFATGRGAAAAIYNVIDRTPEIDSFSAAGKTPTGRLTGKIEFRDLHFSYPSRIDVPILKGFSLTIKPGQTVAFVGHSGCGKSTCIQLLQRFYDPIQGKVLVDDVDIKDLKLEWLRSQIGVVNQEPVLFNTTIQSNIRYGRENATDKEIEQAAAQANAHAFISKLPNGYQTQVGDRGAQLSGGQKQRVAIARAIIRECPILLLDEATSALDTHSEAVVQAALDRARLGRTTLIVAHRLSTIRSADLIVAINDGKLEEVGTHAELLEKKGLYYDLVMTQLAGHEDDDDEDSPIMDRKDFAGDKAFQVRKSVPNIEEDLVAFSPADSDDLDEDVLAKEVSIRRLLALNKPEWPYMLLGTIMAIFQGAILPFYAIIFGEFLGALSRPDTAQEEANKFSLMFVGIGIAAGIAQFLQLWAFTYSGEALTLRLRKMSFAAMLSQEPAWFDDSSRSIGALCARLSGDAAGVNGATGGRIGSLVQAISTLGFACGLAMYYIPKLGAVALAFVPLVLFGTYFEGKLMTTQNIGEKKALENVSKVAVESVSNIRTVASLVKEKTFIKMYSDGLEKPHKNNMRRSHVRGLIFGLAQSAPLFSYATVLYYGAYLIENEGYFYGEVFKVAESLIFGSMMIGQAMSFAPNYNKGKVSGARILRLLDRKPAIENLPGVGRQVSNSQGKVDFNSVAFSYPTRPSSKILRDLSLDVQPNHSIALVGPSGSGKSTCIQLILRFYDPISGTVNLDNMDVSSLNVDALRSQMAIVSQEPALFDRTLRDNISYGDNSRTVTMEECIEAAKLANIHSFISQLPAQYDTMVGEMGSQLSGGQKQRVAIARALIRKPKVLLLDEATSALDMESEKVVQTALDVASSGRTTITIAHRLSSIQNADKIYVINNGSLAESGTHTELLQHQGIYNRLWNMQGSNK